jgi:hypothetical protein
MQVELFSGTGINELQKEVNEFLSGLPAEEIVDVKFTCSNESWDVLVCYTK